MSAAFSLIIIDGALVLPDVNVGTIEASATYQAEDIGFQRCCGTTFLRGCAGSSAAGIAAEVQCARCWGRPEDAVPLIERTALLNPLSADRVGSGSGALMKGGRFAADSTLEQAGFEPLVPR
jgi:hypothetical protein